ncbi:sugar ABC transporter permease [Cellulomonas hominis]|jgi:multiple sugar transport system permease protein|uniref:Multiple sugar transport system permease protein n=1 Tax=Cellulomonas hominis TaxID=156981 RepID=A0A511FC41_9CELL|nr:sugar ABC transporter permease [Cellulomonas hominis]MBB5472689.1 multiple sugar transport system permease protein [Cellulomonas hominis]MBU5421756.1 sugar ABC transporter permease [Cellulomonas hominis]NKY11952.1 sugar ABC transporter permease [Cellulomonas hominis]GEL46752.1 sugar ABC transporter permease [Cellulomonas hominis]
MSTAQAVRSRKRAYRAPAPLGGRGAGRAPARTPRGGRRRTRTALAFLAPALLVLGVFVVWPMISALQMSFTDASGFGQAEWVGLENYTRIFTDPDILDAVGNTVLYAVLFTPTAVIVALALALLLNDPRLPFRGLFRTALFLPFIISLAVGALAWSYLIDPQVGLLHYWLRGLGIDLGNVLQDPTLAMPAVALVAVWKNFGFYMVIFLAGLQDIPGSLYEAAKMDGAGAWSRFRHITLPMLSNTTAFVLIFALIAALQAFDQIYVMTGGGPYGSTQTVVMEIYESGFRKLELGFASALSYVLLLATLVLSLVQFVFFGRREEER